MEKDIEFGKQLIEAFKTLNASIYRYVYIRVGYRKEIAQDITQDVFEKAWKAREAYDSEKSSLKNWLFIITRNRIIDFYRSSKEKALTLTEESIKLSVNDFTEDKILFENILVKLKSLPEKEQELITLYYISDLSIKEIASIVGKKYTAAKISIYRALEKLKKLVKRDER